MLANPVYSRRIGERLAAKLAHYRPDSILSPALGGIIIGHEVAAALGVRFQFSERDKDGRMSLRRGFHLKRDERVVVVEDVVTTGNSTNEVANLAADCGSDVVAIGSIIDRSEGTFPFAVPYAPLMRLRFETYAPTTCPLCSSDIPMEKPGSRKA
jgi:orotate phosphoribosyltransferase